jgi:hypothetical protein
VNALGIHIVYDPPKVKLMLMKLNCDEATTICDKNQYGEASFWEKVKLNIHVFLCKKCGMYSKQNYIMTRCYDLKAENEKATDHRLKKEEKDHMQEQLENHS